MENNNLDLSQWGLPDGVLENYRKRGINQMFPWQLECLTTGAVLEGENLVYTAPTSAGKTLVAEILVAQTIFDKQKKALIILPFVSVVREKMFYFQDLMSSNGIRVEGFMGGHTPTASYQQAQLGVCTIEKANALINRMLEEKTLSKLGIVVVDELHLLGDPYRGYLLELLLTKLKYMSSIDSDVKLQIVGMSATLPNLNMLAKWLNAQLYYTEFRPIPLTERLKCGKTIYNNKLEKVKDVNIEESESGDDSENVGHLCIETISHGHSILIFCPTKVWCESLASKLAAYFRKIGCSKKALEEGSEGWVLRQQLESNKLLEVLEHLKASPVGLDKDLAKTVPYGVAFHHAGLTLDERDIIEGSFRKSLLRVLCATSTLSSGVNLPARRVIIRSPMSFGGMMDILTYRQMIGRAGRMGVDTEGESILICKPTEKSTGQQLMCGNLKPVESCLGSGRLSASLKRAILEVVASGVANTLTQVSAYAASTFLAFSSKGDMEDPLTSCMEFLIEHEFIRQQDGDVYVPTPLGQACLASSLPPDEGLALFRELERARRCFVLDSDLHIIYQVTPYSVSEQWSNIDWLRVLNMIEELSPSMKRVAELVGVEDKFLVKVVKGTINTSLPEQKNKLSIHRRFYTALALQDLVREVPLPEVAKKYECNKGMLQSLQQSAATYAGMVSEFAKRLRWSTIELIVSQFQDRLQFGVQRELCELMWLPSLNGERARRLFSAGYTSLSEIANADIVSLESALLTSKPFETKCRIDGETGYEHAQRARMQAVWVTGRAGLTTRDAAETLIKEARSLIELKLGVEAVWAGNGKMVINDSQKHGGVQNNSINGMIVINDSQKHESVATKSINEYVKDAQTIDKDPSNYEEVTVVDDPKSHIGVAGSHRGDSMSPNVIAPSVGSSSSPDRRMRLDITPNKMAARNTPVSAMQLNLEATETNTSVRDSDSPEVITFDNLNSLHSEEIIQVDTEPEPEVEIRVDSHCKTTPIALSKSSFRTEVGLVALEEKLSPPKEVVNDFEAMELDSRCDWDITRLEEKVSCEILNKTNEIDVRNRDLESKKLDDMFFNADSSYSKANSIRNRLSDKPRSRLSADLFEGSPKTFSTPVAQSRFSTEGTSSPDLFSQSLTFDTNLEQVCGFEEDCQGNDSPLKSDDMGFFSDSSPVIVAEISKLDALPMETVGESFFSKVCLSGRPNPLKRKASPDIIGESDDSTSEESTLLKRSLLRSRRTQAKRRRENVEIVTLDADDGKKPSPLEELVGGNSAVTESERNESCHTDINQQTQVIHKAKKLDHNDLREQMEISSTEPVHWESFNVVDVCGHDEVFESFCEELKKQKIVAIALGCRNNAEAEKIQIGKNIRNKLQTEEENKDKESLFTVGNSLLDGMAFYWEGNDVFYLSLINGGKRNDYIKVLKDISESTRTIRLLDSKEQLKALRSFTNIDLLAKFEDPKVAAWLCSKNGSEPNIQAMLADYLPQAVKLGAVMGAIPGTISPGLHTKSAVVASTRASCEAFLTFNLMKKLLAVIGEMDLEETFRHVEMPIMSVLYEMEEAGFPISADRLTAMKTELDNYVSVLERKAHNLAGRRFALSSYAATSRVLYTELRLGKHPERNKKNTGTSKEALKALTAETKHALPEIILKWRKVSAILTKVVRPFLRLLPKTRIYGNSQTYTTTGRISMKEPNLQNIPRDFEIESESGVESMVCLRDIFVASEGFILLSADYCQIELRLLAHISQDASLINHITSTSDVFKSVASTVFGVNVDEVTSDQRQRAKQTCYGTIYGIGGRSLGQQLDIEECEAQILIDDFRNKYTGVRTFLAKAVEDCVTKGYVETMSHRRRYIPSITSNIPSQKKEAERQAVNTIVQGSAADLLKCAMVDFRKKCCNLAHIRGKVRLLLHLHDELIYEVRADILEPVASILKECMEKVWTLSVPLPVKVQYGTSWGRLQPFNF